MPRYSTKWVDYRLPTGQEFSVAACEYSGKIRHMTIGNDTLRRMLIRYVNIQGQNCEASQHYLALECPLNRTPREHLLHMLGMSADEPLDDETSALWGTESTIDGLVKFVEKMNKALPKELQRDTLAD